MAKRAQTSSAWQTCVEGSSVLVSHSCLLVAYCFAELTLDIYVFYTININKLLQFQYYNNALIIYNDARVQDSMRYGAGNGPLERPGATHGSERKNNLRGLQKQVKLYIFMNAANSILDFFVWCTQVVICFVHEVYTSTSCLFL